MSVEEVVNTGYSLVKLQNTIVTVSIARRPCYERRVQVVLK